MLSASDIASMQATCGTTRTTPCQILRKSQASDGMGGQADTWSVISDPALLCRVAPVRRQDREVVALGRLELVDRWLVALPVGTDVDIKDRIVAQGSTYEVAAWGPRTVELERIVQCERVTS